MLLSKEEFDNQHCVISPFGRNDKIVNFLGSLRVKKWYYKEISKLDGINQHAVCTPTKEESHNQYYVISPFGRNDKIASFLGSLRVKKIVL